MRKFIVTLVVVAMMAIAAPVSADPGKAPWPRSRSLAGVEWTR